MVDDFDAMDKDAGVTAVIEPEVRIKKSGIVAYRDSLIKEYHGGATSLSERLRARGLEGSEALLITLLDEIVKESDNLLGNHLVASENGELRDASVISYKRTEVLEKAMKAVQSKQQFERENGVDLDSPSMMIVMRFFLAKTKHVFEQMGIPDEQSDLFFTQLGESMEDWKKELKEEFESVKGG